MHDDVVTAGRLQHLGHPELDRYVASAVAKQTGRGWRLSKTDESLRIDAVVALALAIDRAEARPAPARLVGWL